MVDMTTRFFEDLDRRGFEPLLVKTSGTLRFDLHEGPHTTNVLPSRIRTVLPPGIRHPSR